MRMMGTGFISIVSTCALAVAATACGGASAKLAMANNTPVARASGNGVLSDGTSLRLKITAVYLAEDVDPTTMNNVGNTAMIWLNPECQNDIENCNPDGLVNPPGPRIKQYFDLSRSTAEVDAELNSQGAPVDPGTYKYARIEMCKVCLLYTSPSPRD